MAVIELGYISPGDDLPERAEPGPYRRRSVRRLASALLAVLCLTAVTASAAPGPARGLRTLWQAPFALGSNYGVIGGTVFVLDQSAEQVLTAYAAADGRRRWFRQLPYRAPYLAVAETAGVLLLPSGERVTEHRNRDGTYVSSLFTVTVAVDARTGAERWRYPGTLESSTGELAVVTDHASDGHTISAIRILRLRDGAVLWSRAGPGVDQLAALGPEHGEPDRLVTVTPTGDARVLRLSDGAEVSHGRVEWHAGDPWNGDYSAIFAQDDVIVTARTTQRLTTAAAYSAGTLAPRWRIEEPSNGGGVLPCGPVLCVTADRAVVARDWRTGAVRWQAAGQDYVVPLGGGLLLAHSVRGSRQEVVDGATGRLLSDLGYGSAAWDDGERMLVALRPTRQPVGRTAVSRVHPGTGTEYLLGSTEAVTDYGCDLHARRLMCPTVNGSLTVTAVG